MRDKIYHILLRGECELWLNAMKHFFSTRNAQLFHLENNSQSAEYIFCDLDNISPHDLKKYSLSKKLYGFYTAKPTNKKTQYCEAVFQKTIPLYKVISLILGEDKPISSYNLNELILLKSLHAGLNDKQISYDMNIPLSTVKYYLRCLYKKLNVSNRTKAALVIHEFIV